VYALPTARTIRPPDRAAAAGRSLGLGYEAADQLEKGPDIIWVALDAATSLSERTH
jgi:hypothetical protein